ncbi:MAG: hypothetical protein RI894_2564 [Bacteroidota bacterium]|jgi:thiol-disulfide isomerase/thioredoxin
MRKFLFFLPFLLVFSACVMQNPYNGVAPGIWRGVLFLEGKDYQKIKTSTKDYQATGDNYIAGQLPFNFEVKYDDSAANKFHIEIINGDERIRVDDIKIGRNRLKERRDTIHITLPIFHSYISAIVEDKVMEGYYVVPSKENYRIKFVAKHAQSYRFTELKNMPKGDINGKWDVVFSKGTPDEEKAVGEFKQHGEHLTGTFMTETGDYRYLEGTVQSRKIDGGGAIDKMYLSCFDGSHTFLFEAIVNGDEMNGGYWYGLPYKGKEGKTSWTAKRNPNASLRDPHTLTTMKGGASSLDFSFPSIEAKNVSSNDFKGKVRVVQILGSWCPNCLDETRFLMDYLQKNANENLQIIGLAYEKSHSPQARLDLIKQYQTQLKVPYPLLSAGYANKDSAAASLPELSQIMSFPTTIFIDKKGKVRRIHTGFSGPATSDFAAYKNDFQTFIKQLLDEK